MRTIKELIHFDQGLQLESGSKLDSFDLMVETYGELNEDKSNAILVCHAFSGNHHAIDLIISCKKLLIILIAINTTIGEKSIPPAEGIKFLTGLNTLFEISSISSRAGLVFSGDTQLKITDPITE